MEVALEGEVLEVGVGHQQRQGGRALVDLAALDAHPAVLDHVEPTEAVRRRRAALTAAMSVRGASGTPSSDTGTPDSKPTITSAGSVAVGPGHRVDVLGGGRPRVLDDAALDGPAPQVLVDRVRASPWSP